MSGEAAGVPEDQAETSLPVPELPPTVLSDAQLSNAVLFLLKAGEGDEKNVEDAPFREISSPRKRAYLIALALTGVKVRAARVAGVSHNVMYTAQWQEDAQFKAAEAKAMALAADVLEAELHRRAVEGVVEPVGWYKGQAGGLVRKFSDVLLIFALKGALPDKYKDRMEVRGTLATLDLTRLTDDQLSRIANGEHPLAVLGSTLPGENEKALPAGIVGVVVEKAAQVKEEEEVTEPSADENT